MQDVQYYFRGKKETMPYKKLVKLLKQMEDGLYSTLLQWSSLDDQVYRIGHYNDPLETRHTTKIRMERFIVIFNTHPQVYLQALKDALYWKRNQPKQVIQWSLGNRLAEFKLNKRAEEFKAYVKETLYPQGVYRLTPQRMVKVIRYMIRSQEKYGLSQQRMLNIIEEVIAFYEDVGFTQKRLYTKVQHHYTESSSRNVVNDSERKARLEHKRGELHQHKYKTLEKLVERIDEKFQTLTSKEIKQWVFPNATPQELELKVYSTNREKTTLNTLYDEQLTEEECEDVSSLIKLVNSGYIETFIIDQYDEDEHEWIAPEDGGSCHSMKDTYHETPEVLFFNGFQTIIIRFKKGWLRLYVYRHKEQTQYFFSDVYGFSNNHNNIYSGSVYALELILEKLCGFTLFDSKLNLDTIHLTTNVFINPFEHSLFESEECTIELHDPTKNNIEVYPIAERVLGDIIESYRPFIKDHEEMEVLKYLDRELELPYTLNYTTTISQGCVEHVRGLIRRYIEEKLTALETQAYIEQHGYGI